MGVVFRFLSALVLVGGVGAAVVVPPAAAEPGSSGTLAPVMMILDGSGSMQQRDVGGGVSRSDAAKVAAKAMIAGLPSDARMGLSTYGTGTGNTDPEKAAGCRDFRLTSPVGAVDKTALSASIDAATPRGWTPMGHSLREASNALPKEGARSIVLVSDGDDTCAPPPACDVAKQLAAEGVDMRIHVVGFHVDDAARGTLRCIADVGRGQYVDAPDAAALKDVLPRIVDKALRTYQAQGMPVDGTPTASGAPELTPGQYLDVITSGATAHYTVNVPEGMTVHAAATLIRPASEGSGGTEATFVDVKMTGPKGVRCGHDRDVSSDMIWNGHNTAALSCVAKTAGKYDFSVERGSSTRSLGERQVEIMLAYEPPVTADHGQSPVQKVPLEVPNAPVRHVAGGGSFNDATELTESGTYSDVLRFGELVVYKVPLAWGQGLAYQVTFGDNGGRGTDNTTNIETELFNPVRQNESQAHDTTAYTGQAQDLDVIATPLVYHGNRSGSGIVKTTSIAGDYYITVKVALPFDKKGSGSVPVQLKLAIDGKPIAAPFASAGATSTAPPQAHGDHDDPPKEREEDDGSDSDIQLIVAGSAAVILVLGGAIAVYVLIRRRK